MEKISLQNTLPQVFTTISDSIESEIWLKSLTFERGRHYLIKAASGVGKSSLCSFIYGNRSDYQGTIKFDEADISTFDERSWIERRNGEISMLFQDLRLFDELTAMENVELKNQLTGFKSRGEIESLFEELGIADKMDCSINTLSCGQQQRVALVRALCQPFDFILLDEPISHLDRGNGEIIARILLREASERGSSIVATSIGHHLEIDYDFCYEL